MHREIDPVAEFFDNTADRFHRQYYKETAGGYNLRVRRKKVLELFDQPGGKVVDVGCGPAEMMEELRKRGCSFWGVDPSARMLEIARTRVREDDFVHLIQGSATRLAFPDNFFDAALCMGVIDAVREPRKAVREMLRVLRLGGSLIISFTNRRSPYAWWRSSVFYPLVSKWHSFRDGRQNAKRKSALGPHMKQRVLFRENEANELLLSEGASLVESVPYYYNVFLSPLDEIWPGAAISVARQFDEGHWRGPRWLAMGYLVKAKKIEHRGQKEGIAGAFQ